MEPTISVIIPAYNVEKYIGATLDSLARQTVMPHEIIIINDGSTDNTRSIIAHYASLPGVRIIDKANEGLGPTRNLGLALATGDYLYFFDADDLIPENFIAALGDLLRDNGWPDLLFFAGSAFADDHVDLPELQRVADYSRAELGLLRATDFPNRRLFLAHSYHASACLYLSRRELWLDNQLNFKAIIHEDEELIFQLISCARTVYVTSGVYFYRRIRPGSIMASAKSTKNLEGYHTIILSLLDYARQHQHAAWLDHMVLRYRLRFFFKQYATLARNLNQPGYVRESLRLAWKAKSPVLLLVLLYAHLPRNLGAGIRKIYHRLHSFMTEKVS